ncbi:MAG: DUF1501 domain-containing protein, partial [Planctomycetales bacterium]|nr:DUF1501 domain-containing protein [Planctomycetales bacterium]
ALLQRLNARFAERHPGEAALAQRRSDYQMAFRMQTEVPELLDLKGEPTSMRLRYGLDDPRSEAFGRRCLLARRLLEKGVRFVQVYSGGWDSHDYLERSHGARIASIDRPVAGLIQDLHERGMLDETLVVMCGEFGRSPDNGLRDGSEAWGRDHNANAMSVVLAGGGVTGGRTVGATDEIGGEAVETVHPIKDFHVTLLRLLGLDDNRLTFLHEGRFKQLSQTGGAPIAPLLT